MSNTGSLTPKRGNLRRLIALLAAVTLVAVGCGSAAVSTPSAGAPSASVVAQPFAGTTLHVLMEDVSETRLISALLPDFLALTGIQVAFESVPYSNMYEKFVPELSGPAGSGTYDLVPVDYYWPGEFARSDWMVPLDDLIARDKVDYSGIIPAFFNVNGTVDGKTYYIPYYTYPMGIVYRTDLNIQVPKTMAEYVALTKSLKKGDFAGSAMQGAPTDPIAMEWLNFLYAEGGDLYSADLKTPTINNAIGLKALTEYMDMIDNAAQTGAAGANLDDASNQFTSGKAATMVTYIINFLGVFQDPKTSQIVDKWDIAPMPGTGVGNVGVWSFGIPKSSKNQGAAWEFIKWVTSEGNAKQRAVKGGAPVYGSFYSDPEVLKAYPLLAKALPILKAGKGLPLITKQQDMVATLGRELSEAVSKRKTPQQALDAIADKLAALAAE